MQSLRSSLTLFASKTWLLRRIKRATSSKKLILIELFSSLRHLSVLFYSMDLAKTEPDVALILFFLRFKYRRFLLTPTAIAKSSPPASLIELLDKSSLSKVGFSSRHSAKERAVASEKPQHLALRSRIELLSPIA